MINKNILLIILLFSFVELSNAQNKKKEEKLRSHSGQLPSLAIGLGVLTFDGDIGNGIDLTSLSKIRGGYSFALEQRIGRAFGVMASGVYGKLADGEMGAKRNLNFESAILQADINLVIHIDNDILFKRTSVFAPYIFGGFGILKFESYGDLENRFGIKYNYWADGTIRDLPDSTNGSNILQRDYTYETKLNDSAKYSNRTFALPLGLGLNVKITDKLYFNFSGKYNIVLSDWIDNYKAGKNDNYFFANIALHYNFGNPYDDSNPVYNTIDFSSLDKIDTDEDGVKDGDDVCPGTPKGVKTNINGCPEDGDEDGISDYLDKEPLTKKGAFVDNNGVTITDQMISESQIQFSSVATERSNLFNENPSLKFLQDIEAKSKNARKNNPKGLNNIPLALRSADKNSDGYISTNEIGKAIDSFFEGDTDFTVEKLNDLIDYFFEQ